MKQLLNQCPPDNAILTHPVYITPEENKSWNALISQLIDQTDNMILDIISTTSSPAREQHLEKFKKDVLGKKKSLHINFLGEILELSDLDEIPPMDPDNPESL